MITAGENSQPYELPKESDWDLLELVRTLKEGWRLLVLGSLLCGILALGVAFGIDPTFTARTTFLPPQQGQSSAALALGSLGPLAGLAGGAAGLRSPGEQYVALMQSATISDRIIEQFDLMKVYKAEFRVDARKKLGNNVRIALGRKDGLIAVEVNDKSPQRAADIANRYVDELRRITATLAVTEAQQRRAFFEQQMKQSQERVLAAQQAMQASGFSAGAYLYLPDRKLEEYVRLAGGPTSADGGNDFRVRTNGSVISGRQRNGSWFNRGNTLDQVPAEPGNTIFVPEELDKTTLVQNLKDWSQILSQFGLGAAAIKVLES